MDNRNEYADGWNPRGARFHALKSRRRQGQVNIIAAFCDGQLLAPFTLEAACNRTVFETWLKTCLTPVLMPGQNVVLDNATFHKGGNIEQMILDAGCDVWYLLPYSPGLNLIERCWFWLKSRIRKKLGQADCWRDPMEDVLRAAS